MPRPLLPPRGMFITSEVVFNHDLSPVLRDTWIQLRALAWGQDETPPLTIKEIANITGKSEKTIYGHLSLLRSDGALRWHPSKRGTIIVEFRNCRFSGSDVITENSEAAFSENSELPVNVNALKESLTNDILFDDSFNVGGFSENSEIHSENSEKQFNSKISEIPTLRDAEKMYCNVTGFVTVPMGIVPYLEKILDMICALGVIKTEDRLKGAWGGWLKGKRRDNGGSYSRTNPAWIDYAITGEIPSNNNGAKPPVDINQQMRDQVEAAKDAVMKDWR